MNFNRPILITATGLQLLEEELHSVEEFSCELAFKKKNCCKKYKRKGRHCKSCPKL